jgi:hypothetical protein
MTIPTRIAAATVGNREIFGQRRAHHVGAGRFAVNPPPTE